VHTGRAATRALLTAELGVTRATAGAVAAELEALGLIRVDTRPAGPSGSQGRPSHRLGVAPGGPVALAAQVHADGFRAALVGLGKVEEAREIAKVLPELQPGFTIRGLVLGVHDAPLNYGRMWCTSYSV